MNELRTILKAEAHRLERENAPQMEADPWRMKFHLMPPTGWMNDPNGLCQFHGIYHVFFQYTPYDARGGLKVWGHYSSRDLIGWEYHGVCLTPDSPYDVSGVYSGSALIDGDAMVLYYTGNVKYDGDYDYVESGREGNTIMVTSPDGFQMGDKICVLRPQDYPHDYTCHIRDPKVWKENGQYYMVLGGRKKGDKGAILLYSSADGREWKLEREFSSQEDFGYMWECPDFFCLDGQWIAAFSPQGVGRQETAFQNIYHSGYVMMPSPLAWDSKGESGGMRTLPVERFREWDMGFDFYAPQTFLDEAGRRILVGWIGLPDGDKEYQNPTVERGWQHALTLPREVTRRGKMLCQYPVGELKALRGEEISLEQGQAIVDSGCFDLVVCGKPGESCRIAIHGGLVFSWRDGMAALELSPELGRGRAARRAQVESLWEVRILADASVAEIYVNGGETVFTTRYYPDHTAASVSVFWPESQTNLWTMGGFSLIRR